jgi:hypothetical protein
MINTDFVIDGAAASERSFAGTAYIMAGSPLESGYCESVNSKRPDELFNNEIFYTLKKAKIIIENWSQHYNTVRPHSWAISHRHPKQRSGLAKMDRRQHQQ